MKETIEILSPEVISADQVVEGNKAAYAIIGTREPDEFQAEIAFRLAWAISNLGNKIVRTGAANGIDKKTMDGTGGKNLEVFIPWHDYNRNTIPIGAYICVYNFADHGSWTDSVYNYHPNPSVLSRAAIALHARNFGIVGKAKAVIAFPRPDGGGGTAQGVRIARALGIKVIQINRGTITSTEHAARTIGKILQELGFVSSELRPTIQGNN